MHKSQIESFRFVFPRVVCFLSSFGIVDADDLNDCTLRECFEACEKNHAVVYWGCWDEDELDTDIWTWRQMANI